MGLMQICNAITNRCRSGSALNETNLSAIKSPFERYDTRSKGARWIGVNYPAATTNTTIDGQAMGHHLSPHNSAKISVKSKFNPARGQLAKAFWHKSPCFLFFCYQQNYGYGCMYKQKPLRAPRNLCRYQRSFESAKKTLECALNGEKLD